MIQDGDATVRRKLEKTYLITGIASKVAAIRLRAAPTPNRKLRRETPVGVVWVDPGSLVAIGLLSPFLALLPLREQIRLAMRGKPRHHIGDFLRTHGLARNIRAPIGHAEIR